MTIKDIALDKAIEKKHELERLIKGEEIQIKYLKDELEYVVKQIEFFKKNHEQ